MSTHSPAGCWHLPGVQAQKVDQAADVLIPSLGNVSLGSSKDCSDLGFRLPFVLASTPLLHPRKLCECHGTSCLGGTQHLWVHRRARSSGVTLTPHRGPGLPPVPLPAGRASPTAPVSWRDPASLRQRGAAGAASKEQFSCSEAPALFGVRQGSGMLGQRGCSRGKGHRAPAGHGCCQCPPPPAL